MNKTRFTTRNIVRIAVLSALAAVLYALPGIPIIPPIYKLDFSIVPVWLAAFILGPVEALIVALIKDLTGLMHSSSSGIGEIADFLCSVALVVPSCALYKRSKGVALRVISMAAGVVCMVLVGAAANYWIMIPFYVNVQGLPLDTIIQMIAKAVPNVKSLPTLIAFATSPFNLLKGAVLAVITWPIYWNIRPYIKK